MLSVRGVGRKRSHFSIKSLIGGSAVYHCKTVTSRGMAKERWFRTSNGSLYGDGNPSKNY